MPKELNRTPEMIAAENKAAHGYPMSAHEHKLLKQAIQNEKIEEAQTDG